MIREGVSLVQRHLIWIGSLAFTKARKMVNHEPDEEEKAAAYYMYILKSHLAALFQKRPQSRPWHNMV
jgi:hypothetical protein